MWHRGGPPGNEGATRYSSGQLSSPAEPERASSTNENFTDGTSEHEPTLKKETLVLEGGAGGCGGGAGGAIGGVSTGAPAHHANDEHAHTHAPSVRARPILSDRLPVPVWTGEVCE